MPPIDIAQILEEIAEELERARHIAPGIDGAATQHGMQDRVMALLALKILAEIRVSLDTISAAIEAQQ